MTRQSCEAHIVCAVSAMRNFAEVVGELVDTAKGRSRRPDVAKWNVVLTTAVEIWKERKSEGGHLGVYDRPCRQKANIGR